MNEQAIKDAYDLFVKNGYSKSIDEFKKLMSTNQNALIDSYNLFKENGYGKSIDDFMTLMGVSSMTESVNTNQPVAEDVKKKGQATTVLPSEDSSSELLSGVFKSQTIPVSQNKPKAQTAPIQPIAKAKPAEEDGTGTKILKGIGSLLLSPVKTIVDFADNAVNASKAALQQDGFFDDDTPDTETPISDVIKKRLEQAKANKGDASPLDVRQGLANMASLIGKIINSSLPNDTKKNVVNKLQQVSNGLRGGSYYIDYLQDKNLADNLPVKVTKNILEFAPDLAVAALAGSPAAAESKLAKWTERATEKSLPIVEKYAPKAAKVLEEGLRAPITKVMMVKGAVKGMADTKEGENPYINAVNGAVEGGVQGVEMHGLGVAAGEVANPMAKLISKSGLNSAIATAIATPLANAGVFTTARALRTGITEGRMITAEEAAEEAGTGIGFSLLHLGSQLKNHNQLNYYYDKTLRTNEANSLFRVLNETKTNLDLAYDPELTSERVSQLEEARDELREAILKEPDLKIKQQLGNEAIKIQNQIDAYDAINGIVENKDEIVDYFINSNEHLDDKQKEFYTKKVNAIADSYDMSEYGVKKRELDAKIIQAQDELDLAGEKFSNLKTPSDRAKAKNEVDNKRKELEELNNQLNQLITDKTNQDAIQKQKSNESMLGGEQPELGLPKVGEGNEKPEATTEQETVTAERTQEVEKANTFTIESTNDISDGSGLVKKGEVFNNPEKVKSQLSKGDKIEFFADKKRIGIWDGDVIVEDGTGNRFGTLGVLADKNGYIKNLTKIESELKEKQQAELPEQETITTEEPEKLSAEELDKNISLSGLNEGFKNIKGNGEDERKGVYDEIYGGNSFAKIAERDGKKYVVVGLTLKNQRPSTGMGRDNYSFASIELNDRTPDNIVEILENKAKENFKNVYPDFSPEEVIKPITTVDAELKALKEKQQAELPKQEEGVENVGEKVETKEQFVKRKKSEILSELKSKYPTLITGDDINPMVVQPKYMSNADIELAQKFLDPNILELEYKSELTKQEKGVTEEPEKVVVEEPKTDEERKSLSSKIRSLKSDPNKTYDAILGIPVAIWDGSIELISKSIDAGVKVADAIKRGINYIEKNHRGRWDKKEFNDKVIASLSAKGIDIQKEELDVKKEKENAEIINGFYSPLEQGLLNSNTEKTTGKEWIKKLEGTTEGDELRFTGVQDFLSQNSDKSLTKQEVLDYMKNNRIEIKEVVKEKLTLLEKSEIDILKSELQLLGTKKTKALLRNDKESAKSIENEEKILFEKLNTLTAKETKYRAYQLPGDKINYKEVLITLPKKEGDKFKSSHYDEPNILAHIRMNTRIDSEGNKVLHIEEFQSDWGQKGKKEGFKKELTEEQKEFYKLRDLLYGEGEKMTQEQIDRYDYLYDKHASYLNKIKYGIVKIPEGPFVTKTADWTKLAWKVALKEAVKQKADKITWTTGEQQNERYDLSKQVDGISYSRNEDGTYYVSGQKNGKSIFHKDNLKEKELEANIGKEVSQKIINGEGVKDTNKPGRRLLKGEDLEIGGAGMKGFYGSPKEGKLGIVGEVIKSLTGQDPKITKIDTKTIKLSSDAEKKMEEEGWTSGEPSKDNYTDQYSIDITPEIKESIELGTSTFKGLSETKSLADKIRAAKLGGNKAFDAILGIPVAIWDGSVELVAKTVETGKSLGDAIKAGIRYIQANHKDKFDAKEYERKIKAGFIDGYEDTMNALQDDVDIALGRKNTWENRVKELTDKLDAYKETDEYKEGDKRGKADKFKKAIEEAKQERDTSYESTINDAMKTLKNSEMYKNATSIEQEELVRDVRERFELKEKKAPSPEKLLGEPKSKEIVMTERQALKKQIQDIAKGAKEGAKSVIEAKKKLNDYFESVKEYGNLTRRDIIKIKKVIDSAKSTEKGIDKAVDKINDIIDKAKTDIIEISEAKMLRDTAKELKASKKSLDERRKVFAAAIKNIEKSGKITSKQSGVLIDKINKVNVESDEQMEKVIEYAEKVFADAEYDKKLKEANEVRSQLIELSKSKNKDPYLKELATKFANIKPSMVDDIDVYNDMALKIKESLRGSKIVGGTKGIKVAEMVSIADMNEYVEETMQMQRDKLYEEKLAAANEAFDTDLSDMTYEELVELMNSTKPEDEKKKKEKETIIKDAIKKFFNSYSAIVDHIINKGTDPFTGEPIDVPESKKDLLRKFMSMDIGKLEPKDALDVIDSLMNFIQNGSTANMDKVYSIYKGEEEMDSLNKRNASRSENRKVIAKALRLFFSKGAGKLFGQQFTNQNILLDKMFKGESKSAEFSKSSGITMFKNKKTYVQAVINQMVDDYSRSFYKAKANGKDFRAEENIVERGMIADLKRNVIGSEEEQNYEFNRKKKVIEQSIKALKEGTEKEQKLGDVYQKVYDKIVDGSENIDDVISKSDKNNVDAVDWWVEKWDSIYDQLKDVSENIHNEILDKESNYTTRKFSKLDSDGTQTEIPLGESLFFGNNNNGEYVYKKKTGVLEKVRPSENIPTNSKGEPIMYRDLSFDKSQVNAMHDALMDIHTSAITRQMESFFKSSGLKKVIPESEDRKILYNSVQDLVRNARNKQIANQDELSKFARKLNKISSLGVSAALGGVTQPLKQTIPVAINTLINTKGRLDLGYYLNDAKKDFLDRIGYGISVRGRHSLADVQSVNKMLEKAAETTPEKGLEMIENASNWWLKTWLEQPDVYIARASWLSYYEKALRKQGEKTKNIDYNKHEVNHDAAEYAQRMVDRQQNISDKDLQGKFFRSKETRDQLISKVVMPFANFRMNQTMRMMSDLTTFTSRTASLEDRKSAAKSLAGFGAELAAFKILSLGISLGIGTLTKSLMGKDETDEEYEKRKDNAIKAQVTGAVSDVFSPLPILDYPTVYAADKVMDLAQSAADIEDEEKAHLFTGTKSTSDAIANMTKSLGILGIAAGRANDLANIIILSNTGHYKDEYGRDKYISEDDQEALKTIGIISFMSNFGSAPAEVNTIAKDALKYAKEDASTKTPEQIKNKAIKMHGYKTISDMKRYDPELYEKTFGSEAPDYEEKKERSEIKKKKTEEQRKEMDEEMDYVPKKKRWFGKEGEKDKKENKSWFNKNKKQKSWFGN